MKPLRFVQRAGFRPLFEWRPGMHLPLPQLYRSSTQTFRTRPFSTASLTRSIHARTPQPKSLSQTLRRKTPSGKRFDSSDATPDTNLSLSQRLKKLSREYGWSALGVYLLLSALDFPFCFLAVRWLGTDRIGHWEHVILSYVKDLLKWPLPQGGQEAVDGASQELKAKGAIEEWATKRILEEGSQEYAVEDHGFKKADEANRGANASVWTQLALAYAIHKSFIFIRVPLTAAVTPKVVKTLRSWGWNIGKAPGKKAVTASQSGAAGMNTTQRARK